MGMNMSGVEEFKRSMAQKYPMRMNIGDCEVKDDLHCTFKVQFSNDDFFRVQPRFIPLSFFMELLGQAAEYFIRSQGEDCKRYLVQVNGFSFDPDLFQRIDLDFYVRVEITQKFGKLLKSHISLVQNDTIFCEGEYVHCSAE